MSGRRKAYIAGPMTGKRAYNYDCFIMVEAYWEAEMGYEAHSPFEANSVVWRRYYGRDFNPHTDRCDYGNPLLRDMYAEDVKLLLSCDVLVLLDGWEQSPGSIGELTVARLFKMPVFDQRGKPIEEGEGEVVRTFESGATRDSEEGKLDYEGFLAPGVLRRFAEYMHEHRVQSDGSLRASDNWQKGMPFDVYVKSLFRHFMDLWTMHRTGTRGGKAMEDALCAMLFNVQGYLFELQRLQRSRLEIDEDVYTRQEAALTPLTALYD